MCMCEFKKKKKKNIEGCVQEREREKGCKC